MQYLRWRYDVPIQPNIPEGFRWRCRRGYVFGVEGHQARILVSNRVISPSRIFFSFPTQVRTLSSAKRHFRYVILPPASRTEITLSRMSVAPAAILRPRIFTPI